MPPPVTGSSTSDATGDFAAQMAAVQKQSEEDSLITAQTNEKINSNNQMANAASSVNK